MCTCASSFYMYDNYLLAIFFSLCVFLATLFTLSLHPLLIHFTSPSFHPQRYKLTPADAIDFLERKRPQVSMNMWQRAAIENFHQDLLHKSL